MVESPAQPSLPERAALDAQHSIFLNRSHFGSLDGLRCISIVAVIWSHGPGQAARSTLLASGRLGVDLFFAISGFLITSLLLRERRSTGDISLGRFYGRRSLRIFPLYYAVLALYTILVFALERGSPQGREFFSHLPYFLTYTSNWFVATSATFGFAWSLATEEQFYCAWPWAVKFFPRWAPVALLGVIFLAVAAQHEWISITGFPHTVLSQIALPICFGVLLAIALHRRRGFSWAFRLAGHPISPWIALAGTALLIEWRADRTFVSLGFALIVGTCIVREDHWLKPVLASRAFVQIGAISYGMYLLHGLVYNALEIPGDRWGWDRHGVPMFVLALLFTILAASVSYRYYESFFLGLKKRFAVRAAA